MMLPLALHNDAGERINAEWRKDEYATLWAEFTSVFHGQSNHLKKFKLTTPEKLWKIKASRPRTAVGEWLYKKAIKELTLGGHVSTTFEVVVEMLAKHFRGSR